MATKNYDNFDFDDYQRKLRSGQNSNTGNGTSYDSFDFDDYYIRQNFTQIGASLTSSINNWLKNNESFFSNYNSRLGRYEGKDYLDWSYESDSGDWLSSLATQKTNLENDAKEIRTWLDQYKDYLDPEYYNSVAKALKGNTNEYEGILSRATEINSHWSQWETEDAYNEWVAGQRDLNEKLNFDLGAGKVELDEINNDFNTFKDLSLQLTNLETEYARAGVENARELAESDLPDVVAQINAITSKYGVDAKGLASFVSEKNQYYTLAERAQNAKELASVADPTSKNYDAAFAEKSQYQSTKFEAKTFWDKFHTTEYGLGYDDLTHEYINGDESFRSEVRSKYRTYSRDNAYDDGKSRFEEAGYDYMSEDEIAIYNYYYNTEGKAKAEEYLDSLTESLQYRLGSDMALGMEGRPVSQYIFAVEAGLDQFATGVTSIFSDEYTPTNATQIASGMVREDLAGDDDGFKIFGSSIGQVGYDVINTTANMLPSILASTAVNAVAPGAGAVVGAGLMGASAGGSAKAEMLQLGYSKEQANAYGLMVGAAEAGMEYLLGGITKLGGKASGGLTELILSKVDNAFARTAIKIGSSMLSEGFEEGIQTVIEPWLKEIATSVDWEDPTIDEVLYSSLLGALSAFGLEGGTTIAGEVNTYRRGQQVRKTDGGVGKLQSIGSTFSADTVAYKIASKVDAFTDAYTIGRLLQEVGGSISGQNYTDIYNGLIEKGIRSSDAATIAREYQAFLNGEMAMSDEQVKILENLSPLADVLRKNIIGANTTVYQRTRAYADIMSLADEVANGKKSKATTTEKPTDTAKSTMNVFDQQAMEAELKKVASDVASGSRTSMAGRVLKESVNSASEAAAEKLGVEGRYISSETGATRLASNKKKVNIVGVDSIVDGVMKVKLNDGSVVDADEIDFSSSDEALVYEAVTNMGVSPTTAWEILKAYNPKSGQSGTIYAMGALEAYTYGHNGVKVDGMSKDGFSALLSPVQKNTANKLGDIDARAKVEAQQKNIDKAVKSVRDEAKSKHKAIPKRKGETIFEGDRARLTELQEKQLGVLEKVASGLGVTFHIFESKVDAEGKRYNTMPDGKITGANGWYDPKTGEIWIDLHAGNDGQGTMIFTAAHELTHFIRQWSPAKFKIFADFLFEQYGKKGQDVNQLVRNQIKKAADNGRSISWDEAYEEVIADSCETFLRDSKAAEKISALREKDAGLANKIKSFLGQMLAKMRKLMADLGLAPETPEGQMVAEMTDSLQKLYDLWTDALADAGTAYSTLAEIDFDTDSVAPMLSERTWTASEYVTEREETAKKISKALGVDMKTAYKYIDDINSVARLIADDRARLDYEPNLDEHATVLKPNSDYKYSVDMSTLCAKRLLFTGTFDAIQRALPNTVFDSEDIVALREMMQKRGYEVACGICYVESTRREIGRITQDFINSYKESQKTGKPITRINSEGKVIELKKTKDQQESTADKSTDKFYAEKDYTPTLADLNTTDIDLVKRDHPLVYEAYLNFMNARGQSKPKLLETRAEYKGEILTHFKAKNTVTARNNAGGLRLQSFSDFEVPHLIDMMQIVMDMSRVGLKSQAYTKVPAFAEIFGDTGVKINLSLIAKGDGLDANGNLVFDDVEGINHKEAFKLRDKYSKNVGTILVGKTDAHIIAAMADPRIDYIIPFHKSSWKESLYDALGLTGYADYTDTQHERAIDKNRGKIKDFDPSEYWDFSKSGDENAQIYLQKCREDGRIPKFPQFQGYPGYWKLLIDFKMYDNDGVGSPQEVVRPTFNMEASERILSEYKGGHKSFPVAKDVVEDFVKEHKDNGAKYSLRVKHTNGTETIANPYETTREQILEYMRMSRKGQLENYTYFPVSSDTSKTIIATLKNAGIDIENRPLAMQADKARQSQIDAKPLNKNGFTIRYHAMSAEKILEVIDSLDEATAIIHQRNRTTTKVINGEKKIVELPDNFAVFVALEDGKEYVAIIEFDAEIKGDYILEDGNGDKYHTTVTVFEPDVERYGEPFDYVEYLLLRGDNRELDIIKENPESEAAIRQTEATASEKEFSNKSIPQKPNSVNRDTEKNSLRNVEPIEISDYVKMYHHFGSTKNYDVAGYILGNGMMLDFSGKHWGDDYSTSRQVDHRDIQEVLGNRGSNNGVNAMIDMIGNGNIRLMPEVGGINLAVKPNGTQMSQLRGYINHFKGEVTIDIDEVGGDTIHSFSYTRGTSSAKVLADIKAYFDEGIVPQQKEEGETDIHQFLFSEREAAPPTKTKKAYKLMRLVDKKLYPLFIGNNEEISVGTWYNADSPNLSQLKNLAPGTHLVDMETGEAMTWDEYAEKYVPKKNGKPVRSKPSKDDVHWANDNGYRFMHIEEKAGGKSEGTMLKKYGDTRAYYNWGVNGSSKTESGEGSASLYALRPGWHFGEVPSMHQIGYDGEEGETVRLDNQVWVEVEMSADVDYNAEAEANWSGDIPTHIPTNGYYRFATNPTQKKTKGGNTANDATKADWFVAGAFKVNRILSDSEADSIVENYNKANGKNVPLDYRRNHGRVFNAETMSIEDSVRYSDRSPSAVSTRTLLANALETTAQNDIEKNKLAQYKDKIDLIESEYAKLTEIRAKIKELSFAKGARDTKAIKDLQFQANQTANRINVYDRQLLNLESTTALKNVLQREKKLAYDKAKKEGKDALAKYKERAAKTQRELMNRNTESRQKAIEGRDKTAMRHKIRNIVDDLNKLLLNPTKDKHIPISLQKPVASALAVINMDTVGADERIAKYNELIAKAKDPDEIARLTKSRDNIELQGESLKDKLTVLQNAYAALLKSDDPLVKNAHDEAIENLIANTVDKVGDTSIRNMSLEQLEAVYDMFKAIKAKVRNTNKMFKEAKQETVTANSEWAKREISAVGGHRDLINKSTKWLKKFGWNMLKPIYAMKLIGSDILTSLYENVRKGEDTWAVDVNEAKDFFKETAQKYEYNTWDFEKQYQFKDSAGHSFSLTIEQIMSLYAYSKRAQADKHLELGGFIFDDSIEVTKKNKLGIPMKYEVNDANPYRLKKEDLAKIINILDTDLNNVKGFVDEMQAYLSDVMGAKGNEVSLAMYDIKLYKEQNYFPLKSAKYFREFDPEKNGTPKIKNSGFSKNTVPQAGNPIVLSNFMDVWANHVNDMSMYHAFVLPLEDFMRVYNYSSTAGGYDSVQQYIKNAYGAQANSYIETLMNDLNGGARSDPATDLISKAMSLFKKAATFLSASVVIQQPSAIARAMAYIDAKYFVDKPEASKHSETWAEVKKYAPVAIIKEMGYFDTNMGRSTVDWIKEEKTWRDKVDDVASKAPALADELAWCAIWKAVKREIADSTNLKVGSEQFLQMAGKRFTEVVTKTQVYDSVLSRSALMRSKDSGAKMITAFMAEPTTSLNMVVDAIIEGKRGNKKFAGKAIGAVATSIILNSILVSLVTAARDDDEDETYTEKYLESLTAELLDGFNPLTYIPLMKDIWSIMQGYDIERSDMSIWSDLWESVENLFSDNKSGFEKTEGVVGSIASIFGLPLKNLMRDARGLYNLASTLLSGTPTTWAGVGEAVGGAVKSSIPLYSRIEKWAGADKSKSDKLYDAIISGDQAQIDRIKAQYSDEQAIESAIKQALRDNDSRIKEAAKAHASGNIRDFSNYIDTIVAEGHFDEETVESAIRAEESAFNTKVNEAAEAKNEGKEEEYKKIVRELRDSYKGIYSQDEIVNLIKKAQEEQIATEDDDVEEATSVYKASDINDAFESGDTDMALEVIDDLFNTKVENYLAEARKEAEDDGKTFNEKKARQEAETKAKSSLRSSMTSYWKPLYKEAYKSKDTDEQERIKKILKDSGLYGNAGEVIETVRKWRTEKD